MSPNPEPADGMQPGTLIDNRYRVLRRLGEGGCGAVFLAEQLHEGHVLGQVVIKLLFGTTATDPELCRRFLTEAEAARRVQSPYAVKVFDCGLLAGKGQPYLVMEHVDGRGLDQLLAGGPMATATALRLAFQLTEALEECHRAGVLHRDLSARNVLMHGEGASATVKLVDFGLAQLKDRSITGSLRGTPRYMAPEQIRQESLDAGVDIFALGVLLFECLTGHPPIVASASLEYLSLNLSATPRPLALLRPDLPASLGALLSCMMAKDRSDRPADMADVLSRLRAIARQHPELSTEERRGASEATLELEAGRGRGQPAPGRRRRSLVVGAGLAVALLAIAVAVVSQRLGGDQPRVITAPRRSQPALGKAPPAPLGPAQPAPGRLLDGGQPRSPGQPTRPGRRVAGKPPRPARGDDPKLPRASGQPAPDSGYGSAVGGL